MLKIRLRRMGAIRQPHYRIVVADSRSPRDGRFIETLGHYNPLAGSATIQIDVAKYEEWKKKGAQPTHAVISLVRQFNRAARAAEAENQTQPETPARPRRGAATGSTTANTEPAPADIAEAPMGEDSVEAARHAGQDAEAITGTPETTQEQDNTDLPVLEASASEAETKG